MAPKKGPVLETVSLRVKPKTIAEIEALAGQHEESVPDVWRTAVERGLPIVALFAGPDPKTRLYGTYTEDELVLLLQPVTALINGLMTTHSSSNGASRLPPLTAATTAERTAPPTSPVARAPVLPFDAAASDALAGLGIDLGI